MSIETSIDNDDFIKNLLLKSEEIPEKLSGLVSECAFIIQGKVMDEAPVITHNLQGATQIENLDEFTARIYPDEGIAPYALFVIMGTAPHQIWPVNAQSLYWPGLEHPLPKGRGVVHPGNQPNPYFERGFEFSKSDIDNEVENFKNWLCGD